MKEYTVGNITFVPDGKGGVMEWGTNLHYDEEGGYQPDNGRRVSLMSYEAFGADLRQARIYASRWCAKAQKALEALT